MDRAVKLFERLRTVLRKSPPSPPAEARSEPPSEQALRGLLSSPAPAVAAIASAVDALENQGKLDLALDLLSEACERQRDQVELIAYIVDRFEQHGLQERTGPLWLALCGSARHRTRAHFQLAVAAEASGDRAAARLHYSHVIVDDIDFAGAKKRLDALSFAEPKPTSATLPGLLAPQQLRHYRLLAEIGRGGSGTVYRAADDRAQRLVALKIFHPHATADWQETRIMRSLHHRGIMDIFEVDEQHRFFSMELCGGGTLAAALALSLSASHAACIALRIADILRAVHQQQVIHGDLKPSNFLFRTPLASRSPEELADALVLSDFGNASTITAERRRARGTLGYLAPEQRRQECTPASDVYAAGVVLLELFWPPAALDPILRDHPRLLRGDAIAPPDGPSLLPPSSEKRLRALLAKLLAADPADRPSSAELHTELVAMKH